MSYFHQSTSKALGSRKMNVKRQGRSWSDVLAAAASGALGTQGEHECTTHNLCLLKMCHSHAGLGGRRNDWSHYVELEFPARTWSSLSSALCPPSWTLSLASTTTVSTSSMSREGCGLHDGEQNKNDLENLDDGWMSSCSVVANPRGCNTMTWRGARYSPKIACLFAEFDTLLKKPVYV